MMEWLSRVVVGGIRDLMDGARSKYGVDPIVFLVIYLGSVPFFYYSIFRMVRALARRRQNEIITWSTVFLAATVAPFLYVLFFGRNLPWWVYLVVALLIGQGVYSLVRRLRHKPAAVEEEKETPGSG
jgi:fatty acid desaturase